LSLALRLFVRLFGPKELAAESRTSHIADRGYSAYS